MSICLINGELEEDHAVVKDIRRVKMLIKKSLAQKLLRTFSKSCYKRFRREFFSIPTYPFWGLHSCWHFWH